MQINIHLPGFTEHDTFIEKLTLQLIKVETSTNQGPIYKI